MTQVLIVEDDKVYREALGRMVRNAGFDAALATGLSEATRQAQALAPDLALVDLRLEDGDGIEVVRQLTAIAPSCRCILLSGHGTIPAAVEAMRSGAVDFLTKPADPAEILAALRDALEPAEAERLEQVERTHILSVLQACGGNISEAARRLGLYRRTLQRKLQKLPPAR